MKKKKVLIFHPALAPYRIDQFNALNELFDIEIVFLFKNVPNQAFNQRDLLSKLNCKYSFLLKGISHGDRVFRFGIYSLIRNRKPNIILGYEYSLTTQYLLFLKRAKLIHQLIGSIIDDSKDICFHARTRIRKFVRNYSVKQLDYLILLSEEVSSFYQNTYCIPQSHIIVSPLLEDEKRVRKDTNKLEIIAKSYLSKYRLKGKKVLLFVGRLVPEKALPRFISTLASLLQEQENLIFVIVGNGIEQQTIEKIVKDYNLSHKIILVGRFEGDELHAWYLCASGFVLPSVSETFGAVVNEALIWGLKVFCSCYAGASTLINDKNGVIFDPFNKNQTKKELSSFLSSLPVIEHIDVTVRPSLMYDWKNNFYREWQKILS